MDIPIVKRCCDASPAIYDYFIEERYLVEVEQNDSLTPDLLAVIAINLVLDELSNIGIETNTTAEDMTSSPFDLDVMFYLRDRLDKDNLYKFFKSLPEGKYSDLCGIIENCTIAEDLLFELVEFTTNVLPTDDGWDCISRVVDNWCSTEAFSKHVIAIQSKIDIRDEVNKSFITDANLQQVTQFLKRMKQRSEIVKHLIRYIVMRRQVNRDILDHYVARYDKDKLRPEMLPLFAQYNAEHPDEEPPFLKEHHLTISHHYEYWDYRFENKDKVGGFVPPTDEESCMIFVSLLLDGFRDKELADQIARFKKFGGNCYNFMSSLLSEDWDAILRGELK